MIGKLTGIVDSVAEDHAILDVGGVGYLVHCPASTLSRLALGATVSLMIETKVSEDAIRLYGFMAAEEREWFRLLQSVQNVGARVALNVLSALSSRELQRALALSDKATIGRAQGVGPKLALRIVTELRDKAPSMMLRGTGDDAIAVALAPRGPEVDAVGALLKLGYSQSQAAEAVARAARDLGDAPADVLIRESLRAMGRP
ncbi:MAG TPA: Holliday junction branch migration protein RuvA [Rhizomicrobium sp.]|jgi:Holliday junction DNA helicase RuvA|nr:Holliday junction branch migration protein RuvA [Rhizomicrobium sp.]